MLIPAPQLPQYRTKISSDGHSPKDAGADNSPGTQPGSSSTHPPASSSSNSSTHSHTQQQQRYNNYNNMSTLTASDAGRLPAWDAAVHGQGERAFHEDSFIPRSAVDDDVCINQMSHIDNAAPLSNTQGYSNVNIDIPLDTQSPVSMEITHDGNVTEPVARLESYASGSDKLEVSHDDQASAAGVSTQQNVNSGAGTVREQIENHNELQDSSYTISHAGTSPRKQLPAHWLPKSTAPDLATAQRAKVRTHKTSSQSGSPIQAKTLRGTRSSFDLDRLHATDGSTFLTKEALAAVENNITTSSSSPSPIRLHHSPSKPSWNSPNGSPLRSSARQHPPLSIKMSPTKSTHLIAEPVSAGHSRATSSVATSHGGTSFHTAHGSPVRSPASTEHSFMSAAETPEDIEILSLDSMADSDDLQAVQNTSPSRSPASKVVTGGKTNSMKPKLALRIPPSDADPMATTSATGPATSNNRWSPGSPMHTSRIPRVATGNKTVGESRNLTLKRTQSVRSLTTKAKMQQDHTPQPQEIVLPEPPAARSTRHVRTVDSSGTTPITSHPLDTENAPSKDAKAAEDTCIPLQHTDAPAANIVSEPMKTLAADMGESRSRSQPEAEAQGFAKSSAQSSRPNSNANAKAGPTAQDPVFADSAIIYSHKDSDAFGTMLRHPINIPPLIVMMAHNFGIGTLHLNNLQDDGAPVAAKSTFQIRGRSDRYVPYVRKQADSEHSTQSSMGSDLRATAAEFVPKTAPESDSTGPTAENIPLSDLQDLDGVPMDMSVLDMHGIPFLWYMYPVEVAYQQGFRNGRMKSPKKTKPKKHHSSLSSQVGAHQPFSKAVPIVGPRSETPRSTPTTQRLSSAELMPPPPIPAQRQENSQPGFQTQSSETTNNSDTASEPFSSQFNLIAQQAALRNRTNFYTARLPHTSSASPNESAWTPSPNSTSNVDRTMIRNVGPPSGPRSMQDPAYYKVPHRQHNRHPGNGLYGGRGNAAGIRLDATLPFPNPVPPQGRPDQGQAQQLDYSKITLGKEACGMVQIVNAMEQIGGPPCNACAPDH